MTDKHSDLEPSMRLKKLVDSSYAIEIDRNIPISRYFKSSRELIKSAADSQESGDIEKAFVLYLRYMTLILEKLPNHPQWKQVDKLDKTQAKNQCNIAFDLAEKLKEQIRVKYDQEFQQAKLCHSEAESIKDVVQKSDLKQPHDLEEIDKKFDFKGVSLETNNDSIDDLFDIEKLKETLKIKE